MIRTTTAVDADVLLGMLNLTFVVITGSVEITIKYKIHNENNQLIP